MGPAEHFQSPAINRAAIVAWAFDPEPGADRGPQAGSPLGVVDATGWFGALSNLPARYRERFCNEGVWLKRRRRSLTSAQGNHHGVKNVFPNEINAVGVREI
jgi:hypothetical protein